MVFPAVHLFYTLWTEVSFQSVPAESFSQSMLVVKLDLYKAGVFE